MVLDSEHRSFFKSTVIERAKSPERAARTARNKGERKQARHYSHLALRISELSGQKLSSEPLTHADRPLGMTALPTLPGRVRTK